MHATLLTSQDLDQLATALSAAQGEIKDADKNALNPHLKSKYADLAEVLQTVRPVLSRYGLAVVQGVAYDPNLVHVTTRLLHKSGQYVESTVSIPIAKADAQGVGAGTTYGRRYGLAAILGISQDDDDGESVKGPVKRNKSESGSDSKTQGPAEGRSLDPGPVAKSMIAKFGIIGNFADEREEDEAIMKKLTAEFVSLTPAEQTQVLPAAKAARARLTESQPKAQ
jgi:hypothetical protein